MEGNVKLFEQFSPKIDPRFENLKKMIDFLSGKNVVFITTSTRSKKYGEVPKSYQLAEKIAEKVTPIPQIINAADLIILPCEGNVSRSPENGGNCCGVKEAVLKDKEKNPGNFLRCWTSLNNKSDELWKIAKAIDESDAIVFFGSIRWASMDSIYQKTIERLNWIQNRHSTLKEENPVKNKFAGVVAIGHNWRIKEEIKLQKTVLEWFGFKTPDELFWNWQYMEDLKDTEESYIDAHIEFEKQLKQFEYLV